MGLDHLRCDGTCGEFDSIRDAGRIPDEFEAVIFTKKAMVAEATVFSDRMSQATVELVDDPRQANQLLAVNNNLQAIESPQGHGDSFWSCALELPEQEQRREAFVVVG